MYFKRLRLLVVLLTVHVSVEAEAIHEKQAKNLLLPTPNKCVALRKGRVCFAEVLLTWQTEVLGDYCIRRVNDQQLLNCWRLAKSGHFAYRFESKVSEQYELIKQGNEKVLSRSEVLIRWVYKSNRSRGQWRLF